MLSTSVIKNTSEASHYYAAKDNYYTKEEGVEKSEWYGKGATRLNLSGEVDSNRFTALLNGQLPNGEQLGKVVDGVVKHRAGWDLTFSAPKSLSILALHGGDKRLLEAHINAVKLTLSKIERTASEARIKINGELNFINTKNMVAALHHHDLSRALDPQVHTHCVVMNMTERPDHQWRSQASKIGRYDKEISSEVHGFIERVRHNKRYFGKLYETELCYQVNQLGYKTAINPKTGVFEITDVPKEVIDHFSKRRQAIEKSMAENGFESAKAADVATIKTRQMKYQVDRSELKEQWKNEAKILKFDAEKIIGNSYQSVLEKSNGELPNEIKVSETLLDSVKIAAKEFSQFKTTFLFEEMVTLAAEQAIREKCNVESLLHAAHYAIQSGELISIENASGKTMLMDKATLSQEKTLQEVLVSNYSIKKRVSSASLEHFIEQHTEINSEAKAVLKSVFECNSYTLIEGDHSRESLLKPIVQIAKSNHIHLAIISPNQLASRRTADAAKTAPVNLWEHIKSFFSNNSIPNYSTMRFLNDSTIKNPDLLLVDKSHLLSTYELSELMTWGKENQKQIIFFGNNKVMLSQKQGKGLSFLVEHGLQSISISEPNGSMKELVSQNDLTAVYQKIADHLIEVTSHDDRFSKMVAEFTQEKNKKDIFLMANNKQSVSRLNQLAHDALKESHQLGNNVTLRVLLPQFINESQSKLASSYQKGNVVRFNEDMQSLGIRRGDYCEVLSQDKKVNEVVLRNSRGKTVRIQPDKQDVRLELFKPAEREYSTGERIQSLRAIHQKNILKGEYLTIQSISSNKMTLINDKGESIYLDITDNKHLHFDYGYAGTAYQLAHETPNKIIAELPHRSFHTDKRQFFQMVSQPNEISIYTDNKDALISTLQRKSGDRLSAHETILQSDHLKQNSHTLHDLLIKAMVKDNSSAFSQAAVDGLDYAMKHLSEREATFSHKDLMLTAMQKTLGKVSAKELEYIVSVMEKAEVLIRKDTASGTLWTTLDAVNMERQIVSYCYQDQGKFQPIVSLDVVNHYVELSQLNSEQINAIKQITQSEDRILAIQGRAGTGKTTLMTSLNDVIAARDLLHSQGYQLRGLAPTHPAVKELAARGIPAQTLDSFLVEMQKVSASGVKPDFSRTLFVLDEASMVSNDKMLAVLKIAHDFNFRQLIPVGDIRQLTSIEAGKPHAIIQQNVNTIHLEDIRRQQNPVLQQGVKETYDYNFAAAFKTLRDSIIEIGNPNNHPVYERKGRWDEISESGRLERIKALVSDYSAYSPDERQDVLIITPGHEDRKLTNALIRDHLKQEGSLSGHEHTFSILASKNLTHAERSDITRYRVGHVIRFGKTEGMVKAGEYWLVQGIKTEHNLLTLKNTEDKEILWQLPQTRNKGSQSFEVFKCEERTLQVGDMLRWSRTDKGNQLYGSEPARVTAIHNQQVTLEYENKKFITVDMSKSQFQHWDYNYALTVYAAQGATKKTVLALLESYRENLIHQPAFLVALTRAVDTFRVYTDNIAALLDRIEQNNGTKFSALETIGELKKSIRTVKNTEHSKATQRAKSSSFGKLTIEHMVEALNQDAEKIATDFLGKPASGTANYLQFGSNKGSLRVTIQGEKAGLWNDFSGEFSNRGKTGGNMFQFLQVFGGMSKKEALEYTARRFGFTKEGEINQSKERDVQWKNENKKRCKIQQASEQKRQEQRLQFARKLAEESKAIEGTLVEKYLKEQRGISLNNDLKDIRFHEGIYSKLNEKTYPAMLVIARDKRGEVRAVQATYLTSL